MKHHGGRLILCIGALLQTAVVSAMDERCAGCHPLQARAFAHANMSRAARTEPFLGAWRRQGQNPACLDCHGPDGGAGLSCATCHRGEHPFAAVTEAVCARCHDAPGENTFWHFRNRFGRLREGGCVDCHGTKGEGDLHAFNAHEQLDEVAQMRVRITPQNPLSAQVWIRHRAGHALPGGTTGQSIWLVARATGPLGADLWQGQRRYGWFQTVAGAWHDQTLPPGGWNRVDWVLPAAVAVFEAELWRQAVPGPFQPQAPGSRRLARAGVELMRKVDR